MQKPQWLNEHEVAAIVGRAVQTLRNDRHKRKGLSYFKIGKLVRYKLEDVELFMDKHKISFNQ